MHGTYAGATSAQRRELRDAVAAAMAELQGADGYRRAQHRARRGRPEASDRARPLEFDGNGFPIAQPVSGFLQRIRRLLDEG